MKPFLLLDCNLSPASGETFVQALERMSHPNQELISYRLSEYQKPDWLKRALDGEFQGIVVSGSGASPKEEIAWIQQLTFDIRKATQSGIPTFGICFGHQLIAHAWGAEVGENVLGYKVRGVQTVSIQDTLTQSPFVSGGKGDLEVLASHRDQVLSAPSEWQVVGSSGYCMIQALRAPKLPVVTVQWHPEGDQQFLEDNPHPDWKSLAGRDLIHLSGNRVLREFMLGNFGEV